MEKGDKDYVYILDTLKKGKEKINHLETENQKLEEANQKLVQLVEKLETIIAEEIEGFDWEDNQYDYPHQWSPSDIVHEKKLKLESNHDTDDIDAQISETIKSLKRAQKFKSE